MHVLSSAVLRDRVYACLSVVSCQSCPAVVVAIVHQLVTLTFCRFSCKTVWYAGWTKPSDTGAVLCLLYWSVFDGI